MMINTDTLNDLYRHMEWADAAVWSAVLASPPASADSKLQAYLYHLHVVQQVFLGLWRGELREAPLPTFSEAEPLMRWGHSFYAEAYAYLVKLKDEDLAQPLRVPWSATVAERLGRAPEVTTVGETGLQVVLHSMYHRGQVNARLREVGAEPPLVDYIAWAWQGKPGAQWPE